LLSQHGDVVQPHACGYSAHYTQGRNAAGYQN
jgi:hypothetical protein